MPPRIETWHAGAARRMMAGRPSWAETGSVMPQRTILTPRELDCLHWSALGKTSWETARILGIAARTVDFHLANACAKLAVANRRAAVARAVQCGLLPALTAAAPPRR
ncbi:transcriptional regulator, LuxR family [Bordetella bronchiseptica 99-R-0433]|nr:transcriptional regulator, LuxR family [Bordetella bronchiseptica 99-R-0433]